MFFHFLPHELEKKDKEDLYEKDKAKLKKHKIDRNWANWFPGSLCRSFFPCTTLEGCCFVAICRYSVQVIHRVFRLVLDPLWWRVRIRAVSTHTLQWDQIQPQLWLQVMTAARPTTSDWLDTEHLVTCSVSGAGPHTPVGQNVQNRLLCWEFTFQGGCNRKSCKFHHEFPVYAGAHSFPACSMLNSRSSSRKPGPSGSGQSSGKGTQPHKSEDAWASASRVSSTWWQGINLWRASDLFFIFLMKVLGPPFLLPTYGLW